DVRRRHDTGALRRGQADRADLRVRGDQARPGRALALCRAGLRHRHRRPATVQRVRSAPGAVQSVHGRGRDLLVAAPERPEAARVRGWAAEPRLRPRQRHRPGVLPGAGARGCRRCRAQRRHRTVDVSGRARGGDRTLDGRRARARDRGTVPRRRHPSLRGRRVANPAAARVQREHGARERCRRPRVVGARAAGGGPRGAGTRRARPPGADPMRWRVAMYTTARERCGIADYSAVLMPALRDHVDLATVVLRPNRLNPWALVTDARRLNKADVAHVQHTYSFFGVDQLTYTLAWRFLRTAIRVPLVVTAHTVRPPGPARYDGGLGSALANAVGAPAWHDVE